MNVKIGYCYYHAGREAVAVCAQCGAGICRECAVKDDGGRIICISCGNSNLRQEHKQYRQLLKQQGGRFINGKEFIMPGIIGFLIVLAMGAIAFFSGSGIASPDGIYDVLAYILVFAVLAYILFSIPFAIILMSDILAPKYDTLYNRTFNFFLKIIVAMFIGWIVFTFYWVRFVILKIRAGKKEKQEE